VGEKAKVMLRENINNKVLVRDASKSIIDEIVKEAFYTFLSPTETTDSNFVIKPNLGFKTDTKGGTTNVQIIESVLKIIRDEYKPRNIFLVESDGIAFKCEDVFEYLDLGKICSRYDTQFINLSREPTVTIKNINCNILKEFQMPKLFTAANTKSINLAKIKTHEIARFSCAIKNLFGLNPYVFKVEYHPIINEVLHDLYYMFKTDLTIVDGIWAINGYGPWTGEPVKLNIMVTGNDALLVDLACLKIIGWDINDVPYIQKLLEENNMVNAQIDGKMPPIQKFEWLPTSKFGLFKENMARALIPLLKVGFPLFYYSQGSFKLVSYGEKGKYCKSIKTFPNSKEKVKDRKVTLK
jgi:uncharacterized protein (DUF362 family)